MILVSDTADPNETEPFVGGCFLKRPPKKLMKHNEFFDYLNNIIIEPFRTDDIDEPKRNRLRWAFLQKGNYEGNGVIEGDKSPVRLLETFIVCQELNIYPPLWVLDEMANIFKTYFKRAAKGDNVKLDDYMGLKKTLYRERVTNKVRWPLMVEICNLNHYWGISIEKSCEYVAEKFRETKFNNNTAFGLQTDVDGETIFKWYKKFKTNKFLNYIQVHGPHIISVEEADQFLQQFPVGTRNKIVSTAKRSPSEQP